MAAMPLPHIVDPMASTFMNSSSRSTRGGGGTPEILSSAHTLLAAHTALMQRVRESQKRLRQEVVALQRRRDEFEKENYNRRSRKRRRSSTVTAIDPGENVDDDDDDVKVSRVKVEDEEEIDMEDGREVYREEGYEDVDGMSDGIAIYHDENGVGGRVKEEEDWEGVVPVSGDEEEEGSGNDDDWDLIPMQPRPIRADLPPAKRARMQRYLNYVPEEETIRNDYSQRYVDGGEWPQNWVLGAESERRFEEYPKQQRLLNLKKQSVNQHSLPPHYLSLPPPSSAGDEFLPASMNTIARFQSLLTTLHPSKFDVILIDPPFSSSFTWDNLQDLPIPSLAGDPSFVFLWVGSGAGEGLERGREVLAKWGYRRCEDVVWVKTNKTSNQGPGTDPPTTSLLTRTKQHCLMGIRGTVRRSTDGWFVHCNVDTDVIIWEGDATDPARKPPEMYTLIENFCLGMRRLEVFGRLSSLRRGWVTALAPGQEIHLPPSSGMDGQSKTPIPVESTASSASSSNGSPGMDSRRAPSGDGKFLVDGEEGGVARRWERERWEQGIKEMAGPAGVPAGSAGKFVVPMTAEIDVLRPKSPVRADRSGGGGQHGGEGSHHHQGHNGSIGGMNMMGGGGGGGINMGMGGGGGGGMNMGVGGGGGNMISMMAQPMAMNVSGSGGGGGGPVMRFVAGGSGRSNNSQALGGMTMLGPTPNPMIGQPMLGGMNNMNMQSPGLNMNAGMEGSWNGMVNPMMAMGVNGMNMVGAGTGGMGGMHPMMPFGHGGPGMLGNNNYNMDMNWDGMGLGMNNINAMGGHGIMPGMGMGGMNMAGMLGLGNMNPMGIGMGNMTMMGNMNMGGNGTGMNQHQHRGRGGF